MDQERRHRGRPFLAATPALLPPKPTTADHHFLDLIAGLLSLLSSSRSAVFLRSITSGLFGALHTAAALLATGAAAALLGLVVVWFWAEEPVFVREPLYFDYTQPHPSAAVTLPAGRGRAVPAGHTVRASLVLLMPESDYNVRVGVFQVTAQAISTKGGTIATSSQPCMLRLQSFPLQVARTFIMGLPLLLGITTESQRIVIELLNYKESYQKSEAISIKLVPRAGTSDPPQIYEAEIVVTSQLPWTRRLVYNWKWTFYIWISLYVYIVLVIVLVIRFRSLVPPRTGQQEDDQSTEVVREQSYDVRGVETSDAFYDKLRKWRERRRSKSRVSGSQMCFLDPTEGSSSTIGETSGVVDESGEFAASESSGCIDTEILCDTRL